MIAGRCTYPSSCEQMEMRGRRAWGGGVEGQRVLTILTKKKNGVPIGMGKIVIVSPIIASR